MLMNYNVHLPLNDFPTDTAKYSLVSFRRYKIVGGMFCNIVAQLVIGSMSQAVVWIRRILDPWTKDTHWQVLLALSLLISNL